MKDKFLIAIIVFIFSCCFYSCDKESTKLNYDGTYNCSVKSTTILTVTSNDTIVENTTSEISFVRITDTSYDVVINGNSYSTYIKIVNDSIFETPYNPISFRRGVFLNDKKNVKYQYGSQSTTIRHINECDCQRK
jgi:hypothetical protein